MISLIPPLVVAAFPSLTFVGPSLLVLGMILVIVIGWRSSFRQSKYGTFAQWVEPSKFAKMEISQSERMQLAMSGCILLSGLLAMVAQVLRLNFV